MMDIYYMSKHKGMILYMAVVLSSIATLIGYFMLNTTKRDILFSSYARQADYAFYAAETGVECALYWDLVGISKASVFPRSTIEGNGNINQMFCTSAWSTASAGPGYSLPQVTSSSNGAQSNFFLFPSYAITSWKFNVLIDGWGYCASVSVFKFSFGSAVTTLVTSSGYNVDCSNTGSSVTVDTDRFRRTIRLNY